jgi:hypothetical protein
MVDKSRKKHCNFEFTHIPKEAKSGFEMRSAAGSAIKVSGTIGQLVHLASGSGSLPRCPATHTHPMKLILDLVRWLWQRDQRESDGAVVRGGEGDDRSSMADFVRLLRMHDDALRRSNYPD